MHVVIQIYSLDLSASWILGFFQFIFSLCREDNVAENLIHGTTFLVPIVKVFITSINMNGFKTRRDADSSKSVVLASVTHGSCHLHTCMWVMCFQAKGQLQASSCLS